MAKLLRDAKDEKMPRLTLSLKKEEIKLLKDISNLKQRPFSRQVVMMMEEYIANHPELAEYKKK